MASDGENTALEGDPKVDGSILTKLLAHNEVMFALALAMVLSMLLLPLPTFVMDLMLSCSIAISLSTLVIVLSAGKSVEFSSFPSLLLFLTLFRLSLNVASTRLILLNGNAGKIIETFGHFVVGGNMVIGLVIFLILVVIQFIVITKGAERISEVTARFTLDAMPGKQMAIDADLNAGLIDEVQARDRREKIAQESEFYGSMDGASKFIRGDAVAGLIITGINLIGGFVVGMSRGLTAGESAKTYGILTIGDGLVSQIPALMIATSAGFLLSKTSSKNTLSHDLIKQMISKPRPLAIASFLLGAMVFIPGFPKIPFIILALGAGVLSRVTARSQPAESDKAQSTDPDKPHEQPIEELLDVDRIAIQVGPRLIKTVDPRRKDSLSARIAPLRRKFAQQYGIILPLVRLRDSISLEANAYEIRLYNHVISTGVLQPDKLLAMDPGTVKDPISGTQTEEPVFHLPALWINDQQRSDAEVRGYTVVDPESILVTHLSETLRKHAYELLSRDDVQTLVDRLRENQPTLVNGVVGEIVPLGLLHRVLQNLLKDDIAIRDLPQILETLGDHATRTKDPLVLTELTRKALVRSITEYHSDSEGKITAIVFDPALEYELRNSIVSENGNESLNIAPQRALELGRQIAETWKDAMEQNYDRTVLLCDYRVRPHLAAMLSRQIPQLAVLAYDEIAVGTRIESIGSVALGQTEAPAEAETAVAT